MTTSRSEDFCENGHDLSVVGRDSATGLCSMCIGALRRARSGKTRVSKSGSLLDAGTIERIRSNTLLHLYDLKHRAATVWERNEIQEEINRLK